MANLTVLKTLRSVSKESKMFNNILVAYDESPESGRALLTGINLAKSLNAKLRAVTVQEFLPPYAGYIDAGMPGGTALLRQQAVDYYRDLQTGAQQAAQREGVILTTELVEGDEVRAWWNACRETKAICSCWAWTSIPCSLAGGGITPPTTLYSS